MNLNLKTFSVSDLANSPNSIDMNYYIEQNHLPAGSVVEIPAFAGSQAKAELKESQINRFGIIQR